MPVPVPAHRRPRFYLALVTLILLSGFALRVWHLGSTSLWVDEAWTSYYTRPPILHVLRDVLVGSIELPLYLLSLRFFPTDNELLLRFPSLAFGVLGIAVFIRVTGKLFHRRNLALLAGALLAFNPYHALHSRTARPYALLFLVTLLASYFFLSLLRGPRTRGRWVGFILCSMLSYTTHYFALFLPLAQYLTLGSVLKQNRRFFRAWLGAQAIAFSPVLLLWIAQVSEQRPTSGGISWIPRPTGFALLETYGSMAVGYRPGGIPWAVVPGIIAAAIGLLMAIRLVFVQRRVWPGNLYWFWLILLPPVTTFIASQLVRPVYVDRYFMEILPGVLLLMLYGWSGLRFPLGRVLAATLVILAGAGLILTLSSSGDDEREDWRGVVQYVAERAQAEDALAIEPQFGVFALRYYFREGDFPMPDLVTVSAEDPPQEKDYSRIWVIYRNEREDVHWQGKMPAFDPLRSSRTPTGRWLASQQDHIRERHEFNGVTVLLVDTAS